MQTLKINSKKLSDALKRVSLLHMENSVLPILNNAFINVRHKEVFFTSTDLTNTIETKITQDNGDLFYFLLPQQAIKYIHKLENKEIEITKIEDKIFINKEISYSLVDNNAEYFPVNNSTLVIGNDMTDVLKLVPLFIPFCGNDNLRPMMQHIWLQKKDSGNLNIFATNADFLRVINTGDCILSNFATYIPQNIAKLIKTIKADKIFFNFNENLNHSRIDFYNNGVDDVTIFFTTDKLKPIEYNAVIPSLEKINTKITLDTLLFTKVLQKAVGFSKYSRIIINTEAATRLKIYTKHEYINFNTIIDCNKIGYDIEISFNISYMLEILSICTGQVTLEIINQTRAITIRDDNQIFLIMPINFN